MHTQNRQQTTAARSQADSQEKTSPASPVSPAFVEERYSMGYDLIAENEEFIYLFIYYYYNYYYYSASCHHEVPKIVQKLNI